LSRSRRTLAPKAICWARSSLFFDTCD
jgi:hypothetical protein